MKTFLAKGFIMVELIILTIVVCMLLLIMTIIIGFMPDYSIGSRVGVINKFSVKGIFIKSYEADMLLALPSGFYSGINTQQFGFNVDKQIIDKVDIAIKNNKRVEIKYRQWLIKPCTIDSNYVVYDIKETER